MRRILSIILLGGVLTHALYYSGFLIDYYVNSDTYKILCENKDKPMLNCDGKCILAKRIAAMQKKEGEQKDATSPSIPLISLQYLPGFFQMVFDRSCMEVRHWSKWRTPFLKTLSFAPFKPPS